MDEPIIRLSPHNAPATVWKWEILLNGKQISSGLSSGSSEYAYTAAHEALLKFQRDVTDKFPKRRR
jgi:hypothetical protein